MDGTELNTRLDRNLFVYEVLLTHVSGEFWLAALMDLFTGKVEAKVKAEFKLDAQGNVIKLGMELDSELAKQDGKIWFSRVE